jgi:polyribonucleotide nucleotidyltransferase
MYLKQSIQVGGRELTLETGKIAKQANGAVVLTYGETIVLTTAVGTIKPREGIDFFPLTVEYREYGYAAGRIPGNYFRREGRPSEKETLTSRLTDRPIRPLFTPGYRGDTQVISLVLSADPENDPDILSITGASAALYLSDIPFETPIAGVRVGLLDGKYVVNPSYDQVRESDLNLIVAGSEQAIVMVEAGANEVSEEVMVEALVFGHREIQRICRWLKEAYQKLGLTKREVTPPAKDEAIEAELAEKYSDRMRDALNAEAHGKIQSYALVDALKEEALAGYPDDDPSRRAIAKKAFDALKEKLFRDDILNRRRRPDGRRFSEIRALESEVGWLPRVHGSALFTRGETQAIVTCTLGTSHDAQFMDDLEKGELTRRFMLNYNFPPFSVGETGRVGTPGRREVGHGALARRAIEQVLPSNDEWPYTIRIVADITESNGSSSMATVCGGILSLMDAGVPVRAPVAGVAMGLVMEGNRFAILSDIAGAEDHYGDMDFKVCGTAEGITALQMDIKGTGINAQVLQEALTQAKQGRLHILEHMKTTLAEPRPELSPRAPRIIVIKIPVDKIRDVIGPGGKMIRSIVEQTGCKIDVEDDGSVAIASADSAAADRARAIIEGLTATAEINKTYLGTVQRLADFGAFVEILPGTDGLLHVSEIADYHVRDVRDELKEGQQLLVKVINIDNTGRIRLSRKALLQEEGGDGGGGERAERPPREAEDGDDDEDRDQNRPPGEGPRGNGEGRGRSRRRRRGGGGGGGGERSGPAA